MTHGALAGLLLRDLIIDGKSRWEEVYEPSRKLPSGVFNHVSVPALAHSSVVVGDRHALHSQGTSDVPVSHPLATERTASHRT